MRMPLDKHGRIKTVLHGVQAGILFLAWVLTIAVFTRKGHSDGRVGWYFGLCWLTIPILIYLVMVPMWSRARRFANVYAYATLDGLSVILWLSAWAAVASYVASGKGKGDKKDASGCDNFKYGSPGRCKLSEAIIVFGVFEMVLFVATSLFSFRAVMTYKRTGMMPAEVAGAGAVGADGKHDAAEVVAQEDDPFSSNIRPDEEDFEANEQYHHGAGRQDYAYPRTSFDHGDTYAPLHQGDQDDLAHMPPEQPQSPLNHNGFPNHDYDTSYTGAYGSQGQQHMPYR
ncbi:hypothetical protein KCU88_g4712, partial [Aureobasidium melanogenum]